MNCWSRCDFGMPKIASGELTFPPGYYYQWAGQFENQVRAMHRLKILIPLCLLLDFVLLYFGLKRWWIALLVFSDILVSASGAFIMLYFWGYNMSVAVWVGYIACFALSVGPVTWVLLSEMFPTKIRGRAMSAAIAEPTIPAPSTTTC